MACLVCNGLLADEVLMTSDCCFPRTNRLLQSLEFQRVFRKKEFRSTDQLFSLLAACNSEGHSRLGLAIAKKKIKTSVARNRLKRLIRESFRGYFSAHKLTHKGLDIVVLAQPSAATADNKKLLANLDRHWEKLTSQCNLQCKK